MNSNVLTHRPMLMDIIFTLVYNKNVDVIFVCSSYLMF